MSGLVVPPPLAKVKRGPMLLELLSKRDILSTLVEKDFKSRYKAKALGRLWSIADPMMTVIIFTIVFEYILKVGQPYFPIFLLLAVTPHRFFSNSMNAAASSVWDNASLVKRVAFPRAFLPIATVLSHARHFFIELTLVILLFILFPKALVPSWNILYLVPLFLLLVLYCLGASFLVSALNVRYRDTSYIINSLLLILYWLSPIFYSFSIVPPDAARFMMLNPMVGIAEGFRAVLLAGKAPDFTLTLASLCVASLLFVVGLTTFRRSEHDFADYL